MLKRPPVLLILLATLSALPARAEVAFIPKGPIYADSKGAPLKAPEGVACTARAAVVADTGNGRLVLYDVSDAGTSGGSEVKVAQLAQPVRVQIDSRGNILVLDRKSGKVARLGQKGDFQRWLEVKGEVGVVPGSFKLDSADNVYLLDLAGNAVLVVDVEGVVVRKIRMPKGKSLLTDLAVDGAGNVYVVDAQGSLVWSAEKGAAEFKPLSRTLRSMVSFPSAITWDGRGMLILSDQNGSGLVLLGADGSYLGRRLAMGWAPGALYYPAQVCVTPEGMALVADRGNNRVQEFAITR